MSAEVEMALVRADISTDCRWTKARRLALLLVLEQFPAERDALKKRFFLSEDEISEWRRPLTAKRRGSSLQSLETP